LKTDNGYVIKWLEYAILCVATRLARLSGMFAIENYILFRKEE